MDSSDLIVGIIVIAACVIWQVGTKAYKDQKRQREMYLEASKERRLRPILKSVYGQQQTPGFEIKGMGLRSPKIRRTGDVGRPQPTPKLALVTGDPEMLELEA